LPTIASVSLARYVALAGRALIRQLLAPVLAGVMNELRLTQRFVPGYSMVNSIWCVHRDETPEKLRRLRPRLESQQRCARLCGAGSLPIRLQQRWRRVSIALRT